MTLDQLPIGQTGIVVAINRAVLGDVAALRLRAMGLDVGVAIETLQRGVLWSSDPLAIRVGRMQIAIRRAQAAGVEVEIDG